MVVTSLPPFFFIPPSPNELGHAHLSAVRDVPLVPRDSRGDFQALSA